MSSAVSISRRSGLRLALWYATLFVVGAIVDRVPDLLPDRRVAGAARSADHPGEARRVRGGLRARRLRALAATVRAEQRTAPERLFVRVVDAASKRSC